ncbi:MAG: hypothetical protein DBP01_10645 [gamma proteobacterium symbiont of Ctena orbiculata]|nr:MAG: hypothetical protein DBP01_10645 [gamma proteobacterium symbiont of Ctena orbiculata]
MERNTLNKIKRFKSLHLQVSLPEFRCYRQYVILRHAKSAELIENKLTIKNGIDLLHDSPNITYNLLYYLPIILFHLAQEIFRLITDYL